MANLFIITAPSGAGKTSLIRAALDQDKAIRLSISHTTRPPRPGEVNGRDYHFISPAEFLAMREQALFIESAEVYGNYYGTSHAAINTLLGEGADVILEIDWQGAEQVRRLFPHAIGIFILPPSVDALLQRLRDRKQDAPEIIERRIQAAYDDMSHVSEFKYVIINHLLPEAVQDLLAIVRAERLTLDRQANAIESLFHHIKFS